jgi:DNA-binding protein Fis
MIYFIQSGNGGSIKIGYSNNDIEGRISALQTGTPYKLKLIGVMRGELEDEKTIHSIFSEIHIAGEWYLPDDTLLKFIEAQAMTDVAKYVDPAHIKQMEQRAMEYKQKIEQEFNPMQCFDFVNVVRQFERELINKALVLSNGKQCTAAHLLGMSRSTLNQKIKVLWGDKAIVKNKHNEYGSAKVKINPTYKIMPA